MYNTSNTQMPLEHIHQLLKQRNFATLVSADLQATHLPLSFTAQNQLGLLTGHLAKTNPHWKKLNNQRVLTIFNGPDSYISPTWYHTRPSVPTWNYVTIHAYGTVEIVEPTLMLEDLNCLIEQHDPQLLKTNDCITDELKHRLMDAIVGIRIHVEHLEGKEKLGQHRSERDQAAVLTALGAQQTPHANDMCQYLKHRWPSKFKKHLPNK